MSLFRKKKPVPESEPMSFSAPLPPPPAVRTSLNIIYRVAIHSHHGPFVEKHVAARSEKAALLAVIESLPESDPLWQAPGWQSVQVYEASSPFILP